MGSTEAILSAQMASKYFSINKLMTSPAPQMQKQSDGSSSSNSSASGSSRRLKQQDMENSAAKVVGKLQQQQQRQRQQLKPRFALELDGLHCFETLVPL